MTPFSVAKMWQRRHDLCCAGRRHAPYVLPTKGGREGFPLNRLNLAPLGSVSAGPSPTYCVGCHTNSALPNKQKTAIGRVALAVQSPHLGVWWNPPSQRKIGCPSTHKAKQSSFLKIFGNTVAPSYGSPLGGGYNFYSAPQKFFGKKDFLFN